MRIELPNFDPKERSKFLESFIGIGIVASCLLTPNDASISAAIKIIEFFENLRDKVKQIARI